ncbi:MAG: hypothetical protein R3C28_13925 [Pirellulaceae bacterium]
MSRSMLGKDDVDCFVFIRQPFDARFRGFSKTTSEALADCIRELGTKSGRRILIGGHFTSSGGKVFYQFFESEDGTKPSPADEFAKRLGFQSSGWSFAFPMGLTPENLIEDRAHLISHLRRSPVNNSTSTSR